MRFICLLLIFLPQSISFLNSITHNVRNHCLSSSFSSNIIPVRQNTNDFNSIDNNKTFNELIRKGKITGDFNEAISLADDMMSSFGTGKLSAVNITGIIQTYGETKRLGDALAILKKMESLDMKPNAYHLSSLLHACRKAKQYDIALVLYETKISKCGYADNIAILNCLITIYLESKQVDMAYTIFNKIRNLKLQSIFLYSTMIVAFDQQGNFGLFSP